MNNLSSKVNQNAKQKYRTYNSLNQNLVNNFRSNVSSITNNNMMGGSKTRCEEALNAFRNKNIDLALYIINTFDCDWSCQDSDGNTVLHHIVLLYNENNYNNVLKKILSSEKVKSFINIKNNEGQTPMLLSVLNGCDKLAFELEKAGANKNIEDNYGNTIMTDNENNFKDNDDLDLNDMVTPDEDDQHNNLLKLLVLSDNRDNLSSLNLTDTSVPLNKLNLSENSSDQFISMIKNNLQDMMNKNDDYNMNESMPFNRKNKFSEAFNDSPSTEEVIQNLTNKYKNNKIYENDHSRDFLHKKFNVDTRPVNVNNYNIFIDSDKTSSFVPKKSIHVTSSNTSSDLPKIKKHSKKLSKKSDSSATSSFMPPKSGNMLDSKTSDSSDVTSSFMPSRHDNMLNSKTSDSSDATSSFMPSRHDDMLDSKTSDSSDATSSFAPSITGKMLGSKTSDSSDATSSFMPPISSKMIDSNTSDNSDRKNYMLETDTDQDIKKLKKSIKNKMNSTNKSKSFENELHSDQNNDKKDIDTDELMRVIGNIQNENDMKGGQKKLSKIVGFRKLKLHSDIENGDIDDDEDVDIIDDEVEDEMEDTEELEEEVDDEENLKKNKSQMNKKSNVDDMESDDSNNNDNELSRLINSRKNEIHNEVINTILGMLNKGEILFQNKPIEASEKNAKLIKAYLYRQVTEKNPQLNGLDKIMIIQKMSKSELLDSLKKMPDLNKLEKNIEEHMKSKREQYESDNNKKESKKDDKKVSKSEKETKSKKSKKVVETESD